MNVAHANTPCKNQVGGVPIIKKTLAIEPDTQTFAALDPEIIARGFSALVIAPPFHGDTLGPFGMGHDVLHMSPSELLRRSIRHLGGC